MSGRPPIPLHSRGVPPGFVQVEARCPACMTLVRLDTSLEVAAHVARSFAPTRVVHRVPCENRKCPTGGWFDVQAKAYRKAA